MSERPTPRRPHPDVRMRGFAQRATVDEALAWLDAQLQPLETTHVSLQDAAGRVLAEDITSRTDVPGFARAMMDGFALHAADTLGATPYNRLPLRVLGECLPGNAFAGTVGPGQAVAIMTGAPLPDGADAVLPAEQTEVNGGTLSITGEVSPGKHVGIRGEDVQAGTQVLTASRLLRPQDVGVLSSIGIRDVPVRRKPRVRVVVTGDELLPAGTTPEGCHIADANGPMLAALVARDGGVAIQPGIVPDRRDAIRDALHDEADVVLVSGGSSVGREDHAPTVLAEHGQLAIHGIAMRPSSPAGMGRLEHRLVFLLPGNPVSCLCAYDFFAGRAIRALGGRSKDWPYRRTKAPLLRKLVSTIGRVDYARLKQIAGGVEPLAISGASILTSTTRADAFTIIPANSEGYPPGKEIEIYLYE